MSTVKFTEHAVLMCHLAEYQDKLDEAVDQAIIEYLHSAEIMRANLQLLREAIDFRDAMKKSRVYIGASNEH